MAATDAVDARRLRRSAFVAGIGEGLAAVALPLLAAGVTRDPLAVAGVVAAQHLPWVLLAVTQPSLRASDRRTLAGASGSLRALAAAFAGVSVLVGDETIFKLQVVAFLIGVAQALDDDTQRLGGQMLPPPGTGMSTSGSLAAAGMLGLGLLGLPLGGFSYEVLAPVPLLFDVGVFAVAALLVLSLKRPLVAADGTEQPSWSPRPSLHAGTGTATAAASLAAVATGAVAGVLVLIALDDLGLGAPAFGLLLAGLAGSSLVGALVAPSVAGAVGARTGTVVALVGSAVAHSAAWYLLDPALPILSVAALGAATAAAMAAGVLLRAQLHGAAGEHVDDEGLRAFHLAVWTATPVGALLGGLAARVTESDDVLLGAAVVTAVAAAVACLVAPAAAGRPVRQDDLVKTP
ncbi:MAG: hypothetical protein WD232_06380 [Acidimicrobiales bacterium]